MSRADIKLRAICLDVFRFDYLTNAHLMYYFQSVAAAYRQRETNRFLASMQNQRLIRRFSQPAFHGRRGGSSPKVVALGEIGSQLVAEELGIYLTRARWKPAPREKNFWFLSHTLEIADYAFALRYAGQIHGYDITWIGETELKRDPVTVTIPIVAKAGQAQEQEKTLKLIPDGMYTVAQSDKRTASYLLELDRGTMALTSQSPLQRQALAQKIAGYQEFMASGLYGTLFGMAKPPRITWVTTSEKRLASIQATVEQTTAEAYQSLHWFTTLSLATPAAALSAPIWSVAGKEGRHVLFKG